MAYNPVTAEVIALLEQVAPGRVVAGDKVNPDYSKDAMPIYGVKMPEVSIDVQSTEEVSGIMKICHAHNIPVTTRGTGTGLVGGCTPIFGGVVICTVRMNKILSYDLENFSITTQAGVLLKDLHENALAHGLLYPPDPGEKLATVGGNVATNAGGMRAVKYGSTRDYVRSITVVLADGEIVQFGKSVSKSSAGYNLLHLMIASEGTLGIICELTLKLIPAPKVTISIMAPFANLEPCVAAVPKIFMNHFAPQAIEFFEREILISSEEYIGKAVFPKAIAGENIGAYLLLTFDGETADELDPVIEKLAEFLLEEGALDVLLADTPPRMKNIWAARSSFLEGIEEQSALLDECDVVVPVNKIADYVRFVEETAEQYDFETKYFGHAGDGNLHIYTCSNDMQRDEFIRQVDEFFKPVYDKALELGGEISGEHGVGFSKVKYLRNSIGETGMALQQGIKKVFDPNMILNPGKICFEKEEMRV